MESLARMKRMRRTTGLVSLLLLPISSIQGHSHYQFFLLPVSWGRSNLTEEERQQHPQSAAQPEHNDDVLIGHDQLMDIFWEGGGGDDSTHNDATFVSFSSFFVPAEAADMILVLSVSVTTALLAIAAAYLLISKVSGTSRKVGRLSSEPRRRRHHSLYLDDDDDDDDEEYGFVDTIKARHQLHQPVHNSISTVDTTTTTTTTHLYGSSDPSKTVVEHHSSSIGSPILPAVEIPSRCTNCINNTVPSAISIQQQQQRPLSSLWAYRPSSRMEQKYKPLCPTVPEGDETEYSDDDDEEDEEDDDDEDEDEDYVIEEKASSSSSVIMDLDGILSELAFALP